MRSGNAVEPNSSRSPWIASTGQCTCGSQAPGSSRRTRNPATPASTPPAPSVRVRRASAPASQTARRLRTAPARCGCRPACAPRRSLRRLGDDEAAGFALRRGDHDRHRAAHAVTEQTEGIDPERTAQRRKVIARFLRDEVQRRRVAAHRRLPEAGPVVGDDGACRRAASIAGKSRHCSTLPSESCSRITGADATGDDGVHWRTKVWPPGTST